MSETRSILKKRPLSHKKTVAFRPKLESVKFISHKSKDGETNWRQELNYTPQERRNAINERNIEKAEEEMKEEAKMLPILEAIRNTKASEIRSIRGMRLTKKRRDMLEKIFRPHTKEEEQELASTLITVSRQQRIPLSTVLDAVQVASTSPRKSMSSKLFSGLKSTFSSKRGGKRNKRYTMKRKI